MEAATRITELAAEVTGAPTPRAALRRLGELRSELDALERRQVARALAEGESFAAIARDLGLSRQAVHRRFRSLAADEASLRTAPDVLRILQYAREEAAALGVAEVGGEHIVVAILRADDLPASAMLRDAGAVLDRARTHVEGASPRGKLFRREADVGDVLSFLESPAREASVRGARRIEVEDVLRGALEDPSGGAARTPRALGIDPGEIRARLAAYSSSSPRARARPRAGPGS